MSKQVTKNQKNDKNKPDEQEQQVFEEKIGTDINDSKVLKEIERANENNEIKKILKINHI